jgi:hypothetical protein
MWRGEWSLHVFPKIKKYTFTALSLSPRAKRRFRFRFLPGMLPGGPGYPVPSMVPSPPRCERCATMKYASARSPRGAEMRD